MIPRHFSAELHCQFGQIVVFNAPSQPPEHMPLNGWLVIDKGNHPNWFKRVAFDFRYLKSEGGRQLYHVESARRSAYESNRLEQSINGWLGLYSHYAVGNTAYLAPGIGHIKRQPFWKIEALAEWDGDLTKIEQVEFYMRDKDGYRVSNAYSQFYDYYGLHAGTRDGDILKFKLRNITLK
ncbi:hypothetical protein [Pseudomonas sichuanensis]|uniref:hypothetical protein n=1 Tax=Pseudomonas TaxID=286 RepID=UPI0036F0F382